MSLSSFHWKDVEAVATSALNPQVLVSTYHSPVKGTRAPGRNRSFLGLPPVVLQSLKGKKEKQEKMTACQKDLGANLEALPIAKAETTCTK